MKPKPRAEATRRDANDSRKAPRQVYVVACAQIAEAIVGDGFAYVKSGPTLYRTSQDFVFQIGFQSSHRNASGKLVALWIHGIVRSPTLGQWRAANPCLWRGSDSVAGGQIGNLVDRPLWMEWNLASAAKRKRRIADAIATIRRIAYPYFAMFDDTQALIARLSNESIPSFGPASALDFLMCFGSASDGLRAAKRMLRRLPGASERYSAALACFRSDGLPSHLPTNHAEVLAAATMVFDFPDLARSSD